MTSSFTEPEINLSFRAAEDGDGRRGELALLRARSVVEERLHFRDRAEGGHGLFVVLL